MSQTRPPETIYQEQHHTTRLHLWKSGGRFLADSPRTHAIGGWEATDLDAEDQQANEYAVRVSGGRVLTAHVYQGDQAAAEPGEPIRIYVITEAVGADGARASTCLMFPSDY